MAAGLVNRQHYIDTFDDLVDMEQILRCRTFLDGVADIEARHELIVTMAAEDLSDIKATPGCSGKFSSPLASFSASSVFFSR
jgi:hypothetical protein